MVNLLSSTSESPIVPIPWDLILILCVLVFGGLISLVVDKKRSRLAAHRPKSGAEVPGNLRPGGFWIRVVAEFIDGLLFGPLSIILYRMNVLSIKSVFLIFCIRIPQLVYKPFMQSFYGATLGKMACGLQVIDSNGQKLTLRAAYIRFIPILIPTLMAIVGCIMLFSMPEFESASTMSEINQLTHENDLWRIRRFLLYFLLVDCVFVAFTHRKRAIHDMMAGSFCVFKKKQVQVSAETKPTPQINI